MIAFFKKKLWKNVEIIFLDFCLEKIFSDLSDNFFKKETWLKIFLAIFEFFQGSGPFFIFSYIFSRSFRKNNLNFSKCHRKIWGLHLEKFGQKRVPKFHGEKCSRGPKTHFAQIPRDKLLGSGT